MTPPATLGLSVSVVIVTINRPDCVRKNLSALTDHAPEVLQTIVVDASPDIRTREVVRAFPGVEYLRNDRGLGHVTASRNLGLDATRGDLVAYLDDDAYIRAGWLEALVVPYRDPRVGGVGGRAYNDQPGEETAGADRIGQLTANGIIEGWFAADPGRIIEVDHLIGCNMSFRREVLLELGGWRAICGGAVALREETDLALRVGRAGYRLLYQPAAEVDHEGAPKPKGARFDLSYHYTGQRNHLILLLANFGPVSAIAWRYIGITLRQTMVESARRIAGAVLRPCWTVAGIAVGVVRGLAARHRFGDDPRNTERTQAQGRGNSRTPAPGPVARSRPAGAEG